MWEPNAFSSFAWFIDIPSSIHVFIKAGGFYRHFYSGRLLRRSVAYLVLVMSSDVLIMLPFFKFNIYINIVLLNLIYYEIVSNSCSANQPKCCFKKALAGASQCSRDRAAKLSLWNFLSLFRDLQKPTRFRGGRGGSSRNFLWSPNPFPREQNTAGVHSETHISQDATDKELFLAENRYFPQITRIP